MSEIPTTPPSGFRDFLPEACALRAKTASAISKVYQSFGFSPIATSAVEDLAVLMGKGGGENEKLIFKILKRGEKLEHASGPGDLADMGLRFDLTLPLARYYSRHRGQLPVPFKAFQIGPVWRAERAQKGRYREFYQCDADILGSESPLCEIEVISAVLQAFNGLGISTPTTVLNDRSLLFSMLDEAQVAPDKRIAVCILLDKLDKADKSAILAELETLIGTLSTQALQKTVLAAQPDLDHLRRLAGPVMQRLEFILETLQGLSGKPESIALMPSLVRGFDYYTGTVFEFRDPRLTGSLGGGGRYDGLTEKFGGPKTPACGASIGFERLMLILEESSPLKSSGPDACVIVFSEELRTECLRLAAHLRSRGFNIDVYPGPAKLKNQFKYADSRGARLALVVGPDEAAAQKIKAKDLKTGEETLETLESLAELLKKTKPAQ